MKRALDQSKEDFSILRRRFKQNTGSNDAEKYRFYGQHFPQLDEFIFKRYFPDPAIQGVFVECGANNGQAGSNCKFFEETLHWQGFNLEPTPDIFALLEKNRPHSRNICAALSDKRGHIDFALTESLVKNEKYLGAVNRVIEGEAIKVGDTFQVSGTDYRVTSIVAVPCLPWRDLIEEQGIRFVDLFVLDTEGHEERVIDGMQGSPVLPQVMCVENGWQGRIREKLAALGYIYDISYHDNHMYIRKDTLPLFALRGLHKNY